MDHGSQRTGAAPRLALIGDDASVATSKLGRVRMVDADHAATTRPLAEVWNRLESVACTYGSVFRGSGQNSRWSSDVFEEALRRIVRFVGAPTDTYFALVGRNTTEMLNRLARRLQLQSADMVVLSDAEHSSNDLPWRKAMAPRRPHHIISDKDGLIGVDALAEAIEHSRPVRGRLIVAITGASNVTGAFQCWRELTRFAHEQGAIVVVDASQLVAHRAAADERWPAEDIPDAIAFAGHKMYAPFGAGFLVVRRDLLKEMAEEDIGGGSVDLVTPDGWIPSGSLLKRELAGSPNFLGVIAAALAGEYLREVVTYRLIRQHEQELLTRLRTGLRDIDGLHIYSQMRWDAAFKCALLSFTLRGHEPAELARRLAREYGIGVRAGHLCQYVLIERLLELSDEQRISYRSALRHQREAPFFGVVRASFGLSSSLEDVDRLCQALGELAGGAPTAPGSPESDDRFPTPWFRT